MFCPGRGYQGKVLERKSHRRICFVSRRRSSIDSQNQGGWRVEEGYELGSMGICGGYVWRMMLGGWSRRPMLEIGMKVI